MSLALGFLTRAHSTALLLPNILISGVAAVRSPESGDFFRSLLPNNKNSKLKSQKAKFHLNSLYNRHLCRCGHPSKNRVKNQKEKAHDAPFESFLFTNTDSASPTGLANNIRYIARNCRTSSSREFGTRCCCNCNSRNTNFGMRRSNRRQVLRLQSQQENREYYTAERCMPATGMNCNNCNLIHTGCRYFSECNTPKDFRFVERMTHLRFERK